VALGSFDEALDAETVLWAVRGLNASRLGVRAEDVVQFLSKDTTLSAHYDCEDVGALLDSLTEEGMLAYEPSTGEWAAIDADATIGTESEGIEPDPLPTDVGTADPDDAFTRAVAELRHSRLDDKPATRLGGAVADAFLRLRVDELERERDELETERDEWRRRAESAEKDAACARAVADELRARVREVEHRLDRERAAGNERSDMTRRAAVALARAQQELERIDLTVPDDDDDRESTPEKRAFRGNWLA
jgi:hypothetical protein